MTKRIFKIVALIIFCLYLTTGVAGASEIEDTLTTGIQSGVGSMDGILKSAPTASPVAGSYTSSQSVSLTAAGSTAICYTTNSTTPVCSSSIACSTGSVYSSALSVSSTTTIKSIACYADASSGPSSSDTYTISSGGGGGGGGGAYVPPPSDSTITSLDEPLVLSYVQEGTLTKTFTDNSEIVIEIPICTVEVETTFDVEQKVLVNYEAPVATVGAILVGNTVFEISAVDADNVAVTSFYRAITITITIPDLPEDTSNLGLYYYNNGTDSWGLIPGAQFDPVTNEVTFTTDHFTKFAVFETTGTPYFLSVDLSLAGVGTIAENALVKTSESPAVYLIESGKRRPITSAEIFLSKGYKWGDILVVSQAEMDNYAVGTTVVMDEEVVEQPVVGTLSDGMLVRKQGTYGVYLIHNNEKRPIKSAEIFLGRGYKWGNVVDIEQSVLDLYVLGEDVAISEDITTQLQTITINTSRLRVRSLAGLEGDIITLVLKGQIYSVLAEQNGWYQINYESGKTGWVMGTYTVLSDSSTVSSIKIDTSKLRVRSLAGLEGDIITLVSEGQEYSILAEQNGWYQINYETGKTGWVMGAYVTKQ